MVKKGAKESAKEDRSDKGKEKEQVPPPSPGKRKSEDEPVAKPRRKRQKRISKGEGEKSPGFDRVLSELKEIKVKGIDEEKKKKINISERKALYNYAVKQERKSWYGWYKYAEYVEKRVVEIPEEIRRKDKRRKKEISYEKIMTIIYDKIVEEGMPQERRRIIKAVRRARAIYTLFSKMGEELIFEVNGCTKEDVEGLSIMEIDEIVLALNELDIEMEEKEVLVDEGEEENLGESSKKGEVVDEEEERNVVENLEKEDVVNEEQIIEELRGSLVEVMGPEEVKKANGRCEKCGKKVKGVIIYKYCEKGYYCSESCLLDDKEKHSIKRCKLGKIVE